MITVGNVYNELDALAPFADAEPWDNVGLLVGAPETSVQRVLFALDVTNAVLEEAKMLRCQLIISHHPVIFEPIKSLAAGSIIYRLAQADIAVISAHTNLDIAKGGVNDALAGAIGLSGLKPLHTIEKRPYLKLAVYVPQNYTERVYNAMCEAGAGKQGDYCSAAFIMEGEGRFLPLEGANPTVGKVGELARVREHIIEMTVHPGLLTTVLEKMRRAHPYEEPAYDVTETKSLQNDRTIGYVGELETPMDANDFAAFTKEKLAAEGVRMVAGKGQISTVAVCGGSGAKYLADAKRHAAHAMVTGEVPHHLWLMAKEYGITLIEAGHFATEAVVLAPLMKTMKGIFPPVEQILSKAGTDGVKYI
jgi:dinuclear metal center YbgI/SA1388 family protein